MTTRLKLYNDALLIAEERQIASLSEDTESRRLLDLVWDNDGVRYCLQQGLWNFAMRSAQLDYSTSVIPPFGYRRAFEKPTDWVRTAAVCQDEFYFEPLLQYSDEVGFLFAELDILYVRYISDDAAYGMNMGAWPDTFNLYVAHYFASRVIGKLSANRDLVELLTTPNLRNNKVHRVLVDARSKDAMDEASVFPPEGSWGRARHGRSRGERGNRHKLIG